MIDRHKGNDIPRMTSIAKFASNGRLTPNTHYPREGSGYPSQADIRMTKAIVDIAAPLGISVHDLLIVGENSHANLKGMKLM